MDTAERRAVALGILGIALFIAVLVVFYGVAGGPPSENWNR